MLKRRSHRSPCFEGAETNGTLLWEELSALCSVLTPRVGAQRRASRQRVAGVPDNERVSQDDQTRRPRLQAAVVPSTDCLAFGPSRTNSTERGAPEARSAGRPQMGAPRSERPMLMLVTPRQTAESTVGGCTPRNHAFF